MIISVALLIIAVYRITLFFFFLLTRNLTEF